MILHILRHIRFDKIRARPASPHTKLMLVQFHPDGVPSLMAHLYCRATVGGEGFTIDTHREIASLSLRTVMLSAVKQIPLQEKDEFAVQRLRDKDRPLIPLTLRHACYDDGVPKPGHRASNQSWCSSTQAWPQI